MSEVFDHKSFLKSVTLQPGVYQMLDAEGAVLYVGKAKQLRKRLASYFRPTGLNAKTLALVSRIHSIQVTVTSTEVEALILEHNLIKQHRAPFNILLRDDKSYPYIFLSDHTYPRLSLHRGTKRGKGRYFGPYPSAQAVRESLNLLQKVFKVRQCEDSFFRNRSRPCLQYQINRCTAPCVAAVDDETYADDVRHTAMFLDGHSGEVINELAARMDSAAQDLRFEEAANLRDQIAMLRQVQARQYMESSDSDVDIIACVQNSGTVCVHRVTVRGGRVLGSRSYFPRCALDESESEVLESFIARQYLQSELVDMPKELLLSHPLPDTEVVGAAIQQASGRKLRISHSARTHRDKWLKLAVTAAEQNLAGQLANKHTQTQRFEALQDALGLEEMPQRLECFDISHSHGEATVASCVVFDQSGPLKSDYRRFNIEGVAPGDDYGAMAQAIQRRYARLKAGEGKLPDILFIDGGKGQVSQAVSTLQELQITDVLIIGVAKGVDRKAGLEVLIRADTGRQLSLPATSAALHLIQHIRDESHRFAITGHKQRRDKARRRSLLEDVAGVGPKRRRELLRHFGGIQGVRAASVDDLLKVPGINQTIARAIYDAARSG